ncbi:hypothetical protein BGZ61DRAFT_571860 [Ilyonectria robusta]|uniref:uncharacterized protein n=1 Tax=Ilyonectria robusta TaxID=1079257 RepID=UPI001E8E9534|nr:uncharacterized protein BGZ61DRAFT_571860 [Ilyonectria robusta]KAH8721747.1 hypothetical protein BGZ61DRAFT_571860 [Ilyonectria robusta]
MTCLEVRMIQRLDNTCNSQPSHATTRCAEAYGSRSRVGFSPKKEKGKIRLPHLQVKCDEGRPACHRCVSTGRTCDGYGIWGGGDNRHPQVSATGQNNIPVSRVLAAISPRVLDAAERDCFEWFTLISAKKLRGLFGSAFWDTLVLQASFNEPAVLHAVLALGSVQRQEMVEARDATSGLRIPDGEEQFMLRQYSKAISHLVPESQAKVQPSVDAVLLTCLLFIFLEFIRGHYKTAQTHLRNGLKLIYETGSCPNAASKAGVIVKSSGHQIDKGILEAFSRIQVQVGLLRQVNQDPLTNLLVEPRPIIGTFKSIEQARDCLDPLIKEALELNELCRRNGDDKSEDCHLALLSRQQRVRTGPEAWSNTYSLSTVAIDTTMPFIDSFGYRLLRVYYTMTRIMMESAVDPRSETVFDNYTDEFASIITQADGLRRSILSNPDLGDLPPHRPDMPQSIADMGWLPPLYYTALKCRVHRLRVHAIELLRSMPHREGIWDANIAALIAQNVMVIEEGCSHNLFPLQDHSDITKVSNGCSGPVPLTPESFRIRDIEIELPNNPLGNIGLKYRKRRDSGGWEIIERQVPISVPI